MNILVTGACGQLGSELRTVAASGRDRYVFADIVSSDNVVFLDITDRDAVEAAIAGKGPVGEVTCGEKIDVVINCAAYTDVDSAEDHEAAAELLNAKAVSNLAEAVRKNDGFLIHVSSDYVFGGAGLNVPINEDVCPSPLGAYGRTKLKGEEALADSGCRHIVLRTAWLYSEFGRNFMKTMLRLISAKERINVVFDQAGTPTYALDLAEAIFHILENRLFAGNEGTYHYSNEGVCSWYDFAKMTAQYSGHTACIIEPCHSDEFPSKVRRPNYSVLDKTLFKKTFGLEVPYWTDSLRKCLANMHPSDPVGTVCMKYEIS